MLKEQVATIIDDYLNQRNALFLIDLIVTDSNNIKVIIDGDQGVYIKDCVALSRAIENNLDRDQIDFSINVTSPGATEPLKHLRQYIKSKERTLEIQDIEGKTYEGKLIEANDKGILIEWKTRTTKPVGKGKITITKKAQFNYKNIAEARVKLKFNLK